MAAADQKPDVSERITPASSRYLRSWSFDTVTNHADLVLFAHLAAPFHRTVRHGRDELPVGASVGEERLEKLRLVGKRGSIFHQRPLRHGRAVGSRVALEHDAVNGVLAALVGGDARLLGVAPHLDQTHAVGVGTGIFDVIAEALGVGLGLLFGSRESEADDHGQRYDQQKNFFHTFHLILRRPRKRLTCGNRVAPCPARQSPWHRIPRGRAKQARSVS